MSEQWLKDVTDWSKECLLNTDLCDSIFFEVGTYVILADIHMNRCVGKSRILYIGEGKIGNRAWMVLDEKYSENYSACYGVNLLKKLGVDVKLSLIWKITGDKDKGKALESKLIEMYEERHGELPPFNFKR